MSGLWRLSLLPSPLSLLRPRSCSSRTRERWNRAGGAPASESEDAREEQRAPFPHAKRRASGGNRSREGEGRLNRCFQPRPFLLSVSLSQPHPRAPSSSSSELTPVPPVSLSPPLHKKNNRSASTALPRTRPGPRSPTASSSASRAPGRTAPWGSTCRSCARPRSTPGAPTSSG